MELLEQCNETELIELARQQGLGRLRRGLPHRELVDIVNGAIAVRPEHLAATNATRRALQEFIHRPVNWSRVMSQLPGCDGCCSTFSCSEGKHILCFSPDGRNENSGK